MAKQVPLPSSTESVVGTHFKADQRRRFAADYLLLLLTLPEKN